MSDLQIQFEEIEGLKQTSLVVLRGSIDAKTVFTFQSRLTAVIERGVRRFVIDMKDVKYVNSTGLGYLINLSDSISGDDGTVALVEVQPKVKVVFDMLGLNEFFKVFDTRDEAVAFMKKAAANAPSPPPPAVPETVVIKPKRPRPPEPSPEETAVDADMPTPKPAPSPFAAAKPRAAAEAGTVPCAGCNAALVIREPGAYRCPRCFAVFQFDGRALTQVAQKRKGAPVQMTIDCSPETVDGLAGFVDALARRVGFDADERRAICDAVRGCVEDVREHAYNGDVDKVLHVLMLAGESRLEMRLADTGATIQNGSAAGLFARAREVMDHFAHAHHPRGGNILTLMKRKS